MGDAAQPLVGPGDRYRVNSGSVLQQKRSRSLLCGGSAAAMCTPALPPRPCRRKYGHSGQASGKRWKRNLCTPGSGHKPAESTPPCADKCHRPRHALPGQGVKTALMTSKFAALKN